MQVRVWIEGDVAIIRFSPFLFCSTKLTKRIITIYLPSARLSTILLNKDIPALGRRPTGAMRH